MKSLNKRIRQFWAEERSLTILFFILLLHIFVVIPFGQKTIAEKVIFLTFYLLFISAGLFFLTANKIIRYVFIIVMSLLVVFGSGIIFESALIEIINNIIIVLFCLLLGWIVLARTFSGEPFTIHRIQGGIVSYLLISLVFAILYHTVYLIEGNDVFNGLNFYDRKEFMYFSLTTLTTVGYGDITPAVAATRSLANLEALIGQLYPAILIAWLVSMHMETSKMKKNKMQE